jgi:hypothetical protein
MNLCEYKIQFPKGGTMRRVIILLSFLTVASLACSISGAGGGEGSSGGDEGDGGQNLGIATSTQDPGIIAGAQTEIPESDGAETSVPDGPHMPTRHFPATATPGGGYMPTRKFPPTDTSGVPHKRTPNIWNPGEISGYLSYPSNFIPTLRVVAFKVAGMTYAKDEITDAGDGKYSMSVPAGTYYIVAYTLDGGLSAGYTQAVTCGLTVNCTDHSLIPVIISPGSMVLDISPLDWYAPAGTFPPMP